jgi:hypothetical protein
MADVARSTEAAGASREVGPARSIAEDAVGYLPRLAVRALEDLHAIALSVRVLPEVARSLGAIEASVDSMDREVKLMRQGVERVDEDVVKVAEAVDPLDAKLDDLRRTLRPLSRAAGRLGLRRGA